MDNSDLGINLGIGGILFTGKAGNFLVMLPDEEYIDTDDLEIVRPTFDEWLAMLRQTDLVEVAVIQQDGAKAILRKSQRHMDISVSWAVFKRDGYRCVYCGAEGPLTVDHIILWQDNGPTIPENLVTCCTVCNKKRGNLMITDWLASEEYEKRSVNLTEEQKRKNLKLVDIDIRPSTRRRSR